MRLNLANRTNLFSSTQTYTNASVIVLFVRLFCILSIEGLSIVISPSFWSPTFHLTAVLQNFVGTTVPSLAYSKLTMRRTPPDGQRSKNRPGWEGGHRVSSLGMSPPDLMQRARYGCWQYSTSVSISDGTPRPQLREDIWRETDFPCGGEGHWPCAHMRPAIVPTSLDSPM